MRRRITLAIMLSMSIILLSFAVVSYYIVQESIESLMNNKLALARIIRNNIDNILKNNFNRLYDISASGSVDLEDDDFGPEMDALRTAYRYSIYTDGVFLLDRGGNVILNYPQKIQDRALNVLSIEPISRMLELGRPVVSNIYTLEPTKRKVLFVLVPLKDKNGNYVGAAGGEIDPTNPLLNHMLGLIDIGRNSFIDIMDSNGVAIASSNPARMLTPCDHDKFFNTIISAKGEVVRTCHQCHVSGDKAEKSTNIMAFVPLEMAPWGISIQEPEEDVFAPALKLKRTFIALGVIFVGTAFLLIIGINRSVVTPVKELIKGTDRIAKGDLSKPILPHGSDEIGVLSQSFETMRVKLLESLESIKRSNMELESRVRKRTEQIKESQKRIENLFKKVVSTQEEERKRIARELHDDTLQDLSAILMRIDMCRLYPENITVEKIEEVRGIVLKALDGVFAVIQNLRPSLLDDLGLEAAIKWLLDMHLGETSVECYVNMIGVRDKRFRPEIEITLFRIIQEAIVNIARHAGAENVFVILKVDNESVHLDIEDDGEGFDARSLLRQTSSGTKDGRGLGLIGMKERASLIEGKLQICSSPGSGTRVSLCLPLNPAGVEYG